MKPILHRRTRSGFLGIVLAVLGIAGQALGAPPQNKAAPTLVFIVKTDACQCELNLCVVGEQEVLNFLVANPWGFRMEKIDLKTRPKAAKEYGVLAVPVAVLLDEAGTRVARFDGFFSEQDLYKAWEHHRSVQEGSR
jgi:hypothetical protein